MIFSYKKLFSDEQRFNENGFVLVLKPASNGFFVSNAEKKTFLTNSETFCQSSHGLMVRVGA